MKNNYLSIFSNYYDFRFPTFLFLVKARNVFLSFIYYGDRFLNLAFLVNSFWIYRGVRLIPKNIGGFEVTVYSDYFKWIKFIKIIAFLILEAWIFESFILINFHRTVVETAYWLVKLQHFYQSLPMIYFSFYPTFIEILSSKWVIFLMKNFR